MSGTISGTTLPGAGVSAFSILTDAFAHATANGSGNYSITGLSDDTYEVTSNLNNYAMTPVYLSKIISGGNTITGVNFTGTLVTVVPSISPIAGDTFVQPNGGLNPAKWTLYNQPGVIFPAVVINNEAQNSAGNHNAIELFTAISWPADVFVQAQYDVFADDAGIILLVRGNDLTMTNHYEFYVADNTASGSTTRIEYFPVINNAPAGTLFRAIDTLPHPAPGTIFKAVIVGNQHFLYQGNTLIGMVTDSSIASGSVGGVWWSTPTPADGQISNFLMGSASLNGPYSVPDCRKAPNGARTVQGTSIYDVQTSSNLAVPGTDSRIAGSPVDSRITSTIPQNSRTPGTFGPGE